MAIDRRLTPVPATDFEWRVQRLESNADTLQANINALHVEIASLKARMTTIATILSLGMPFLTALVIRFVGT